MGIARSVAVVVVGVLMMNFIDQILGAVLLQAVAGGPITDQASYLAVFERPLVPAVVVATHDIHLISRVENAQMMRLERGRLADPTGALRYPPANRA